MIRNVQTLVLAALVALAASAIAAPAAPAEPTFHEFTAQKYPATIHGTDERGKTTIVTEAGAINCEVKVHGELKKEASQTLTLTPTYSACTFKGLPAVVETDGCDFTYHLTTETATDSYLAHKDIDCPMGQAITVSGSTCEFKIPAQKYLETVDFVNEKGGLVPDITMTDTVKNVSYEVTQDGLLCPFGGVGKRSDGTFTSHKPMTLTAEASSFDIGWA